MSKYKTLQVQFRTEPEQKLLDWFLQYCEECKISKNDMIKLLLEKERSKSDPDEYEIVSRLLSWKDGSWRQGGYNG